MWKEIISKIMYTHTHTHTHTDHVTIYDMLKWCNMIMYTLHIKIILWHNRLYECKIQLNLMIWNIIKILMFTIHCKLVWCNNIKKYDKLGK